MVSVSRILVILGSVAVVGGCSKDNESGGDPKSEDDASVDATSDVAADGDADDAGADASDAGLDVANDIESEATDDAPADAPPECVSNLDCEAPTNLCDTIQGVCVECLSTPDCEPKAGTVCSKGACVCPSAGDTWCESASCVDLQSSADNCGSCGHRCFGACTAGTCADAWEPIADDGAPEARSAHVAVWTGTEMIVWGGENGDCDACSLDTGGIYNHDIYSWRSLSMIGAPSRRRGATAVWTGDRMLVWGGYHDGMALATGAAFDPVANTWNPMTSINVPSARYGHTAVWTGTEMIVWGGTDGTFRFADGARYDPTTDLWTSLPSNAPGRQGHSAVWLDGKMVIYGGQAHDGVDPDAYLPTANVVGGWAYELASDAWNALPTPSQPSSRTLHTAVPIGNKMIVWGGYNGMGFLSEGAMLDTSWQATAPPEPEARRHHTAVVLDDQMIVWGGVGASGELNSGGSFNPLTNTWTMLPAALSARQLHTSVSTGSAMMVWGGKSGSTRLPDGAVYSPQ